MIQSGNPACSILLSRSKKAASVGGLFHCRCATMLGPNGRRDLHPTVRAVGPSLAVSDLCQPSIYSLSMTEGAPARPSPQTDPASRAGAKAGEIDPDQGQDEAVRLSHDKWLGHALALDEGRGGFLGFEEVPPLDTSDQSQSNKNEYFRQKRGA